ncbi:MAG: helicase HerA-like domain-containing protein [Thermaurantiacus tibetensis]
MRGWRGPSPPLPPPHRQSPRGRAEAELARVATSVGRSMANQVGRSLVRGLLGGLFGGRR